VDGGELDEPDEVGMPAADRVLRRRVQVRGSELAPVGLDAVVLDAAATDEGRLRSAAQGCPVEAITLWRAGAELPLEENT